MQSLKSKSKNSEFYQSCSYIKTCNHNFLRSEKRICVLSDSLTKRRENTLIKEEKSKKEKIKRERLSRKIIMKT